MFALPLLMLDGIYLYIILTAFLIVTLVTIEYEKPGWCTFMLAITLALLEFYSPWHPVQFALQFPLAAAIYIASYMALGIVWIVLKWISHVNSVSRAFSRRKPAIVAKLVKEYQSSADYANHMPNDYVRYDMTLTDAGQDIVARALPNAIAISDETLAPLTPGERQIFLELLKKLV